MVRSELTGQMADTSSEAWRYECPQPRDLDGLSAGQVPVDALAAAVLVAARTTLDALSHRVRRAVPLLDVDARGLVRRTRATYDGPF
jgi:hypothetical protein